MLQVVIARDALQFLLNNLLHLLLDAPVICLHRFLHAVVAVCVSEIGNNGDFLVGTFLPFYLIGIHHNLAVENLLFDTLVEVVGHRTDEHPLRQAGNFARRDKRVHLRVDGGGNILPVDGDGLPLLKHLSEPLRERLGCFAHHLPGEDIADGIHHDFGLLVAVVAYQLGEILKSQKHGHLVASRRRNQVVQALEIDGRQLVDDNRGFEFPLFTENSLCRGSL